MYHDIADSTIPYPNHRRIPNPVVRGLYKVGYFFADFGPMFVNLFNVVYQNLRRLFAFFVGLLIEISTVIVLLATIIFSIFHSIELLQRAGATGGQEYVGVAIFELVFISSSAFLTKSLMNRRKPDWFSIAGFIAGIIFVEASNIMGMADNWTGRIIGGSIPIMLVISEGVLAYRALSEAAKEDEILLLDIIRRNQLTEIDLQQAIQLYMTVMKEKTNQTLSVVQDGQEKEIESVPDLVQNELASVVQSGTEKEGDMVPVVVEKQTKTTAEANHSVVQEPNHNHSETEPETVPHEVAETVENKEETTDEVVPKVDDKEEVVEAEEAENETSEPNHTTTPETTEPEPSVFEEPNHTMVQKEAETVPLDVEKPNHFPVQNLTTDEPQTRKKTTKKNTTRGTKTKKGVEDPELKKVLRDAKRWGKKFYEEKGKTPGRIICGKQYPKLNQRQARELAEILRKELEAS